jgi:hypothetical protein
MKFWNFWGIRYRVCDIGLRVRYRVDDIGLGSTVPQLRLGTIKTPVF